MNMNRSLNGIFSSLKHFNMIYVPYCSSDLWTGSSNQTYSHGHDIFRAVFHHQKYFVHAKQVVLTGFSAGGLGLLLNLPSLLPNFASQTDIRLILDSAWFIDYPDIPNGIDKINQGMIYWNTQLPSSCQLEPRYRCLLGSEAIRWFPSSVRILILQSLFDLTQLHLDHMHHDVSHFSSTLIANLRQSSQRLSIFAPACPLHGFLFRSSWATFDIEHRTLSSLLHRWLKRNNHVHLRLIDEQLQSSYCPTNDEHENYS
jgi:O-palmitoleoyl-L-serine hydrolase